MLNKMKKKIHNFEGSGSNAYHDIPDGYFDKLSENVMHSIENEPNGNNKYHYFYVAAAVIVLLISVGSFYISKINSPKMNAQMIAYNMSKLPDSLRNMEILVIKKNPNNTNDISKKFQTSSFSDSLSFDNISNEDILQYLIETEEFEF